LNLPSGGSFGTERRFNEKVVSSFALRGAGYRQRKS
jgi:hypothetical protein